VGQVTHYNDQYKLPRRFGENKLAGNNGSKSKTENDDGGSVIQEAFAFEHGGNPFGYFHIFHNGGCGYRVGR
jgi:hypothetical protein